MNNLIISLTSYPARINVVHKTIESLLCQTVTPSKIILWLADEQFPNKENDLPENLLELTKGTNFEIDWCEDIRSYKKLVPALRKYPDSTIITCDDDVIYDCKCVEKLVKAHKKDSESIWCHRGIIFCLIRIRKCYLIEIGLDVLIRKNHHSIFYKQGLGQCCILKVVFIKMF